VLLILLAVGYFGAIHQPSVHPPQGAAAEKRIAEVFGTANGDAIIEGDLLIERFYVYDVDTGQSSIALLCKGRIVELIESIRPDGTGSYTLRLDRSGMEAERNRIAAFVTQTAPNPLSANDLGLRVQDGTSETVLLNYTGRLPKRQTEFEDPKGGDAFSFLARNTLADLANARVITIRGTNFLLSSTVLFPYFQGKFGVKRAVILSEFVVVDLTSPTSLGLYRAAAPTAIP
jgi:hypothetical protein